MHALCDARIWEGPEVEEEGGSGNPSSRVRELFGWRLASNTSRAV